MKFVAVVFLLVSSWNATICNRRGGNCSDSNGQFGREKRVWISAAASMRNTEKMIRRNQSATSRIRLGGEVEKKMKLGVEDLDEEGMMVLEDMEGSGVVELIAEKQNR